MEKNNGQVEEESIEILTRTLESDKLTKRFILNCFMESLGVIKSLKEDIQRLNQTINIIGMDKLNAYFTELDKNVKEEETKENVKVKVRKSHLSSKKSNKSVK